jgi:hypothetical protein
VTGRRAYVARWIGAFRFGVFLNVAVLGDSMSSLAGASSPQSRLWRWPESTHESWY